MNNEKTEIIQTLTTDLSLIAKKKSSAEYTAANQSVNIVNQSAAATVTQSANNVKSKTILSKIMSLIIGIVVISCVINLFGGGGTNNTVINCAKTVVSNQLKSPSSAVWHDSKIIDKDSYGRYLVYLKVEATNSFGGYVTSEYLVVVSNVKRNGTFTYNSNFAVQSVELNSPYYDVVENATKDLNGWNEPLS